MKSIVSIRLVSSLLLCVGVLLLIKGTWIPAKAILAQHLLERSWTQTLADPDQVHPPWPWADTTPVGKLQVTKHAVDQVVLAGASGRNLAFGPTLVTPSASPGSSGHVVLSGHRDTHFQFLADVAVGDEISVQGTQGSQVYEVAHIEIIDTSVQSAQWYPNENMLTLVTCYPFDSVQPNTPLRMVVTALPASSMGGQQMDFSAAKGHVEAIPTYSL